MKNISQETIKILQKVKQEIQDTQTGRARQAMGLVEVLLQAKRRLAGNYLIMGVVLKKIRDEELWRDYGEHLRGFRDFLQEIQIGHSTAYNLIKIWELFGNEIVKNGYDVEYTTLTKLLPIAKKEPEKWLEKAQVLTPSDLDIEIRKEKGKPTPEECPHKHTITLIKCLDCGKVWRADETE